jgi:poly-gamma-glutamate synthesis protein (capsule biosynthesis protein)
VPTSRVAPGVPPPNRPGVPPVIVTWADKHYLDEFRADISALRPQVDIVVGHGPHYPLPVAMYKGKPIFYGLCNLTFSTGHLGRRHAGWIGLLVELSFEHGAVTDCNFRLVRNNDVEETFFCRLDDEAETLANLAERSKKLGAHFNPKGDRVHVTP